MAITHIGNRHSTGVAAVGNSTPLDLPAGGSVTVGNHLILYMALDNSGTGGVDPNCEGISDPRGNVWYRLGKATRSSGAANDGAHVEVWFTRVVLPYSNGDDITPVFSFPVARGAFRINEFAGIRPISYPIVTPVTGTGSSTTITPGAITPDTTGQLVIGFAAIETNTAITGDADTTNGSWSATGTIASNSGTDATSMTVVMQFKIVTAAGAQNWAVTKTGAADYAAIAIVLDTYTPVAPSTVAGNPNYPCIAGPENLGNGDVSLPIDTGTAYMFTHRIFPNDLGSRDYAMAAFVGITSTSETDPVSNHTIVADVYVSGNEAPINDFVNAAIFSVDTATLGSGAETWNPDTDSAGTGTALQALSAVGGECVRLQPGESVAVSFDASIVGNLFPGHRILRWGIRYIAFKDDSEIPGPSNGFTAEIHDGTIHDGAGGSYLAGGWLVNNYRGTAQYEIRWFGEVNGNPRAFRENPLTVGVLPQRACWTPADFVHLSGGAIWVNLTGAESDVFIDYIEGVVELAPERRVAHGARTVSTAPYHEGVYSTDTKLTRVVQATDASQRWFVPDTDVDYVLVVREGLPASPSDLYPFLVEANGGQRVVAPLEAIGPALKLSTPAGPRSALEPTPLIRTGVLSLGVLQEILPEPDVYQSASAVALDAVNYPLEGPFFPAYYLSVLSAGQVSQVFTGHDLNQYIVVPGGQQYSRVKLFVARDDLTSADLTVTIEQPPATPIATATITAAAIDALPDMGRGLREISVPLSVAITPTAGRVRAVLSSSTEETAPWRSGGAIPTFAYGGYDVASPTLLTEPYDYSVVLQCPLAAPTYTLGSTTQDIIVGSESCTATSTALPTITLTNGDIYDHIAIYRSADGEDLVPVALIDGPSDNQVVTDYEVPWDYPSGTITYTLMGYRDADHLSVTTTTTGWTGVSTAPGAAFGLFSNELTQGFAYIPVDQRELDLEYNSLNPVSFVQRHGVNYQIALIAPEERGLSISVTVIVDRFGGCDEESPSSPNVMSPKPFDNLRSLERNRRMMLKLPGGHHRFVFVKVGRMNVRTQRGTYMGEITLTDVEIPNADPYA